MKTGVIYTSKAGFFSNFRGTVSAFKKCEEMNLLPYVLWGRDSIYYDEKYGDNVWEYYFKQISELGDDKVTIEQDFSWRNLPHTRKKMNDLIKKYVIVNDEIQSEMDDFYNKNFKGKNILGVHIRLTDKSTFHTEKKTIISIDNYKKHIKNYLDLHANSYAYISTDSNDYIDGLIGEFGDKVIIKNDTIRTSGEMSVHHHTKGDGYKKGKDVVLDTLLLSKTNFLIKGISNVSLSSLFFNKNLNHFNIVSHYNNDTREDFIKSTLI